MPRDGSVLCYSPNDVLNWDGKLRFGFFMMLFLLRGLNHRYLFGL